MVVCAVVVVERNQQQVARVFEDKEERRCLPTLTPSSTFWCHDSWEIEYPRFDLGCGGLEREREGEREREREREREESVNRGSRRERGATSQAKMSPPSSFPPAPRGRVFT